jgi:hypothetical protein
VFGTAALRLAKGDTITLWQHIPTTAQSTHQKKTGPTVHRHTSYEINKQEKNK